MTLKVLLLLAVPSLALRLRASDKDKKVVAGFDDEESRPRTRRSTPPKMFCSTFVLDTKGTFDLLEKQMKKCDDYAFLSTFDNPERKIFKVMEKAPKSSAKNWPVAEATAKFFYDRAEKFEWFLKVDPDTFFRPKQMLASLSQYVPTETIAVGRPGRHSTLPLVGAAYALSSAMVKQLQTKHLEEAELAKGTWHGEDNVMSAWIPHAGGTIKSAVNADHGCTTFLSTDKEEIPASADIDLMKEGKTYTKGKLFKKQAASELGDICYSSELAAIHPVKDVAQMAKLIADLDP